VSNFHDLEQERTVLSFALASVDNMGLVIDEVYADLFDDTRHSRIWEAGKYYYQNFGGALDRDGLQSLLMQNEVPADKQVLYLTLLDEIKAKVVMKDQFKISMEGLESLRFKRGLYDTLNSASSYLDRGNLDRQKICNELIGSFIALQTGKSTSSTEMLFKRDLALRQALYKDRQLHPEKYRGIPFGVKELDKLTGGMFPGEFIIFFGRPGSGKSTTVHTIAYNVAKLGLNAMIVTIEMSKEQESRRLDSRHLQISARGLRNAELTKEEENKFLNQPVVDLPGEIILVDMPQGCSTAQILPVLRRHKMKHRVDILLVDYLNIMEPTKWSYSAVQRTGDVAGELKKLARLENIPIVTPARATRDVAKAETNEVGTEHLSWSDAMGYDADQIIYLKKGKQISPLEDQVDAVVVKFRDGSNETIRLGVNWDKSFMGDMEDVLSTFQKTVQHG